MLRALAGQTKAKKPLTKNSKQTTENQPFVLNLESNNQPGIRAICFSIVFI